MFKSYQFEEFVEDFAVNHGLFDSSKKYLVAVSTGIDSMALMHFFLRTKKVFEVIHFNHGTREVENQIEESFLKNICHEYKIKLHIKKLDLSGHDSNFEYRARIKRKSVFSEFQNLGYTIVLAHHLDDSFEWSLIQKLRQSDVSNTLGIPIKGKNLIRPFMCVSKAHIEKYMKVLGLEFKVDSTNHSSKYLRNDLRINMIPMIKARFPNYLKHYVDQQNQLAKKLNVHGKLVSKETLIKTPHEFGGMVLKANKLSDHFDEMKSVILSLLPDGRSKFSKIFHQIQNAILELEKSSFRPHAYKGPIHLPHQMRLFILHNRIWIYHPNHLVNFENFLMEHPYFSSLDNTQITSGDDRFFPNMLVSKSKLTDGIKSLPILIEIQSELKRSDMHFVFLKIPRQS